MVHKSMGIKLPSATWNLKSPLHLTSKATITLPWWNNFLQWVPTLCSSFKLLLDITIFLSSSTCLLNVLRRSSSCKQQAKKYTIKMIKKNREIKPHQKYSKALDLIRTEASAVWQEGFHVPTLPSKPQSKLQSWSH
jgi:hypothetical protein